jgi:hypothetical protein
MRDNPGSYAPPKVAALGLYVQSPANCRFFKSSPVVPNLQESIHSSGVDDSETMASVANWREIAIILTTGSERYRLFSPVNACHLRWLVERNWNTSLITRSD